MVSKSGGPDTESGFANALERLEAAHAELLRLCDRLEGIADSLPDAVDRKACEEAAGSLMPMVAKTHRFEEETLFPMIAKAYPGETMARTLERLRNEHVEDECYAEDLTEALETLAGHKPGAVEAETFGYMLRGFFAAMRRHIAFEQTHLPPLSQAG